MNGGRGAALIPTLAGPADAESWVQARVAEGSDFIKLIYDSRAFGFGAPLPTLSPESLGAIVRAAHASGKLAIAHIGIEQEARTAITEGVDGLAHLFTGPTTADFGRFAAAHHVFVIPTFSVLQWICGQSDGPALLADQAALEHIDPQFKGSVGVPSPSGNLSCDGAHQALRQLVTAGVPILVGTDAPSPGTTYGASVHRELSHLVRFGMTTTAALAAATSVPARIFHLDGRGEIQVGRRADLVLVDGDPSKDILATRNIVGVWKRGIPLH